jgi:hypothetical protein
MTFMRPVVAVGRQQQGQAAAIRLFPRTSTPSVRDRWPTANADADDALAQEILAR